MINLNTKRIILLLFTSISLYSKPFSPEKQPVDFSYIQWVGKYDLHLSISLAENVLETYSVNDSVKMSLYQNVIKFYQKNKNYNKAFQYYYRFLNDFSADEMFGDLLVDFTQYIYETNSREQLSEMERNNLVYEKTPANYFHLVESSLLFLTGDFDAVTIELENIEIQPSNILYSQYKSLSSLNQEGLAVVETLKKPRLAMILSAALPGLGQIYGKRYYDGLVGFTITASLIIQSMYVIDRDKALTLPVIGWSAMTFWSYTSNIYGAKLSVDQYNQALVLEIIKRFKWN